ncbi:MAG: thiamine biosynthesis protein ThiS [Candidatus Aenigmarchaeota archaeon]|nr:thiamine biosynthesis protein ThiS [Candidatus Aenigmarchaeota archaeon]
MKIVVQFAERKKNVEVPEKSKVIDVIKKSKVNPETVIVRRGDEILLEEDLVKKNDSIELIRIISGG